MKRSIITIAGISLLTLSLTGCVSGLQGSTYSRSEARQVQEVEFGMVLSTNPVVIEGRQSEAGQLPGAIIGGVAGSSVGQGKGQEIFTILGAVGGAVVGSMIEVDCSRSGFHQHFRQRTTCPGTHARCTGSRLTRIAGLMRAADRGIQIENPDLAHAWDTPVGL